MFVDTHTHLYLDDFQPSCQDAVIRAINAGVEKMILPNVDLSTLDPMIKMHKLFPSNTSIAIGLHPTEVKENWEQDLYNIEKYFEQSDLNCVSVGEIGIDLYWDKTFREQQMQALETQLKWAVIRNIPVIIHCRDGLDEILEVLGSMDELPRGVFHSFGGTIEDVERIRNCGDFYFGINGIVTFKNSKLRDTLPVIGIDRILLETDAPYLAPVPHRGKRNESSYLVHTAAYVAQCLALTMSDIESATTINAKTLFGI